LTGIDPLSLTPLFPPNTHKLTGDVGTVACAAACDVAGPACVMHLTDALGKCTMYSSFDATAAAPDSKKYALCFKDVRAWEAFGQPDQLGMYW